MSKKHLKQKDKQRRNISRDQRISEETKRSEDRSVQYGGRNAYLIRLKRTGNDNISALRGYFRMISSRKRNDG